MRFLVTGGFGFIGSNFVRYVLGGKRDVMVTILDKLALGSDPRNLAGLEASRYRFVKGDICDGQVVEKLLKVNDVVVNFAAESHVDRSISNPLPFVESNVEGVVSILEALRRSGAEKRLVAVSTDEVYGPVNHPATETDLLKPTSPYAATKAAGDLLCLAYARTYGLDVVITRCTNNFGPYQFPEKLIPKTIVRASLGLKIPVYGNGKNSREWLHVRDHCAAVKMIAEKGRKGEVYNISSGEETENIALVDRILKVMRKPGNLIEFVEDRPGHDLRYSLDAGKIRREIGWRAETSFAGALEDTVKWYLENQDWWRPLATPEVISPTPWRKATKNAEG